MLAALQNAPTNTKPQAIYQKARLWRGYNLANNHDKQIWLVLQIEGKSTNASVMRESSGIASLALVGFPSICSIGDIALSPIDG